MTGTETLLKHHLRLAAENDTNYEVRYVHVFAAVKHALRLGYAAGIRLDPVEPDWPCVYIELPTGQVSWHMPAHPVEWDGHTPEEKLERVRAYVDGAAS